MNANATARAIVRLRNRPDRFVAVESERHSYGLEALGQFRRRYGDSWHYYPSTPTRYVWTWREVMEIKEQTGGEA